MSKNEDVQKNPEENQPAAAAVPPTDLIEAALDAALAAALNDEAVEAAIVFNQSLQQMVETASDEELGGALPDNLRGALGQAGSKQRELQVLEAYRTAVKLHGKSLKPEEWAAIKTLIHRTKKFLGLDY